MSTHTAIFLSVVSVFLLCLLVALFVTLRRAKRKQSSPDVQALLARLGVVDRNKVAQVALDFGVPGVQSSADGSLESWQVSELIGGLKGLETLAANCEVLIDLACYVQQWYPEALPVAEQLRLNAREIQWHVERLRGADSRGNLETAFPDYAQRAVAIYYSMTQHVLTLYEASQVPGWSQLQAAL